AAVHVQEIPTGWPVGYGSTWRAPKRADGRNSRIALIPVGYADGYPRALGGAGEKRVNPPQAHAVAGAGLYGGGPGFVGFTGRPFERRGSAEPDLAPLDHDGSPLPVIYAPVVGRVSMDQITVDVTDVPDHYLRPAGSGAGPDAFGEVELYGRDRSAPNYLPRLAAAANSITHELLCRIHPRVERVYRYPAHGPATTPAHTARPDAAQRTNAPPRAESTPRNDPTQHYNAPPAATTSSPSSSSPSPSPSCSSSAAASSDHAAHIHIPPPPGASASLRSPRRAAAR
ncbi:MAG TPA: alanine racemase C-terminal domain-containing protein, partial [Phycisphaerales bacterium]|nr:alanine racemase C-terminal domain-containing protein [Phycisphaerales bacterium]